MFTAEQKRDAIAHGNTNTVTAQPHAVGDIVYLTCTVVSTGACGATGVLVRGVGHEVILSVPAGTLTTRRAARPPAARLVSSPGEPAGSPPSPAPL